MEIWKALIIVSSALFIASLLFLYREFKNAPLYEDLWPFDIENEE